MSTCFTPGVGGVGDELVEDRDEHVHALDREARLAGERAVKEALERLHLGDAIEQLEGIERVRGRAEEPGLGRMPQPAALLGPEDVRVVVAGARAVDAPQPVDCLGRVRRTLRHGAPDE